MDEIENPDVSAAGQDLIGLHHIEEPEQLDARTIGGTDATKIGLDTVELGRGTSADNSNEPVLDEGLVFSPTAPLRNNSADGAQRSANDGQSSRYNKPALPRDRVSLPTRPPMNRESSTPAPPAQYTQGNEAAGDAPDSLTLNDLRRLREQFPTSQPVKQQLAPLHKVYDFHYDDTQAFPMEIDEWFGYGDRERERLVGLHSAYKRIWAEYNSETLENVPDWIASQPSASDFVHVQLEMVKQGSDQQRSEALQVLCYIALGIWEETAGIQDGNAVRQGSLAGEATPPNLSGAHESAAMQTYWMVHNVCMLVRCGILATVTETLKSACDRDLYVRSSSPTFIAMTTKSYQLCVVEANG